MGEEQTDVLVVGAGPVGLWTALLLRQAGVEVKIVDREERTATRSYACALHPHTLRLMERLNLAETVLEHGRRIHTIAFYEGETRRAEVKLAPLDDKYPFLLILPQSALEGALETRLRKAGIPVHWNHRLDALANEEEKVDAMVEELGGTSVGYIVPHWETVVKRRSPIRASFLIGADGANSMVRQRLGIENQRVAGPHFFAAYEFESDQPGEDEVRVVMDGTTTNVLWPLLGNRYRWTFQVHHAEAASEFPEKERRAARLAQKNIDDRIRQYVEKVAKQRAPWFKAPVKEIAWCTEVVFEQRVARAFGKHRCWLAGDAAHQTGPAGVQSMNVGFAEAQRLVGTMQKILHEAAPLDSLGSYEREGQQEWRRLLGLSGGLKPGTKTSPWVRERAARLLPCLPASAQDLPRLASQLALDFDLC